MLQQLAGAVPMIYVMGNQPVCVTAHFGHALKIQICIRPAFQFASHTPPQVTSLFRVGNIVNIKGWIVANAVHMIKNGAKANFSGDLIKWVGKIDLIRDHRAKLIQCVWSKLCKGLAIAICWVCGIWHNCCFLCRKYCCCILSLIHI